MQSACVPKGGKTALLVSATWASCGPGSRGINAIFRRLLWCCGAHASWASGEGTWKLPTNCLGTALLFTSSCKVDRSRKLKLCTSGHVRCMLSALHHGPIVYLGPRVTLFHCGLEFIKNRFLYNNYVDTYAYFQTDQPVRFLFSLSVAVLWSCLLNTYVQLSKWSWI